MKKIQFVLLASFISGSGTKLIQSQLESSKEMLTIPAFPLLYFYDHWKEWNKKFSELDANKILNLILKHHASLIDSRKIKGFNGLTNLGKKKNRYLKISKTKFKIFFLNFLKNKSINSGNVITAIHVAYFRSLGKNLKNVKYFLFHIHNYEFISKYFKKDFENFRMILCFRGPINQFWRRVQANRNMEKARYDYTDQEYIKNYNYFTMIKHFCMDFGHLGKEFYNPKIFVKFENLKIENVKTLKKICSKLKIKFNNKMKTCTFGGLEWWSDKIYVGSKSKKIFQKDAFIDDVGRKNNFFFYEIYTVENLLKHFYLNFRYKFYYYKDSLFGNMLFFLSILCPTKYGLKLFFSRFGIKNIYIYIKNAYEECFFKNMKNYYFNAFYKYKWIYRYLYVIKHNYLRKLVFKFKSKNNLFSFFLSLTLFIFKIIKYPYMQFELFILYFVRIFYLSYYFFLILLKKKYIKEFKTT